MSKRITRDESGFTLVELLVVVTILGILAAIVVFSVGGMGDKGKAAACTTDINTLMTAQEINFAEHGTWSTDQNELVALHYLAQASVRYRIIPPVSPSTTYSFDRLDSACPVPPVPA